MQLNPYGEEAVLLGIDLLRDPPTSAVELADRCRAAGLVVDRRVAAADVTRVRTFLDHWAAVVDTSDDRRRTDRLNALLEEHARYPRLTDHSGTGWHLHYRDQVLPISRVVAAIVTVGTALHLSGRGMHRLGRCAARSCDRPFADVSRTGRQRYCSPACANRDAVRRHRERVG